MPETNNDPGILIVRMFCICSYADLENLLGNLRRIIGDESCHAKVESSLAKRVCLCSFGNYEAAEF
jgi:hypothetical protein